MSGDTRRVTFAACMLALLSAYMPCAEVAAQQFCNSEGNLVMYTNYEGGVLTINVDEDIPNLKIGIISYEASIITIAGPFVGNVTELIYAGWDSGGGCSGVDDTQILGVPAGIVTQYSSENIAISPYLAAPVAPGFPPVENCISALSECSEEVAPQGVQFFLLEFGPGTSLYLHLTQYDCWQGEQVSISEGGNCCLEEPITPENPIYTGGSSYNFLPDTADLCDGSVTFDLSFYPVLVQPPIYPGYQWSDGTSGPVITISTPGTYTVSTGDACHTPETSLLQDQVVVLPCSPVELQVTLSDFVICPGEELTLEAQVVGGEQPYNFNWVPSPGPGPGPFTLTPDASATYILQVTDAAGNTASDTSSIEVISENLAIDLGPDQNLCEPSLLLNAANADALSYLWSTGATTEEITVTTPGVYSVEVIGACGSFSASIELFPCPSLSLSLSGDSICAGETALLLAEVEGGGSDLSYTWNNPSFSGPGPHAVSPTSTTTYSVTVSDGAGSEVSATALVLVNASTPTVVMPDSVGFCPGTPAVLTAEVANAFTRVWSTGSMTPELLVATAGVYSLTASNACGSTTASTVVYTLPTNGNLNSGSRQVVVCEESWPAPIGIAAIAGASAQWSDGTSGFSREVISTGTYLLQVTSTCESTTLTFEVSTEDCTCEIYVPNAFTPNSDGVNDTFKPSIQCEVISYRFQVFDRLGKIIFDSTSPDEAWLGSDSSGDYFHNSQVYSWKVSIVRQLSNGPEQVIEREGHVVTIR